MRMLTSDDLFLGKIPFWPWPAQLIWALPFPKSWLRHCYPLYVYSTAQHTESIILLVSSIKCALYNAIECSYRTYMYVWFETSSPINNAWVCEEKLVYCGHSTPFIITARLADQSNLGIGTGQLPINELFSLPKSVMTNHSAEAMLCDIFHPRSWAGSYVVLDKPWDITHIL